MNEAWEILIILGDGTMCVSRYWRARPRRHLAADLHHAFANLECFIVLNQ